MILTLSCSCFSLVDLSGAARYQGAELDSCLLEERAGGALLNGDQDLKPTVDPAHLPVAPPTYLSALTPGVLTVKTLVVFLFERI